MNKSYMLTISGQGRTKEIFSEGRGPEFFELKMSVLLTNGDILNRQEEKTQCS